MNFTIITTKQNEMFTVAKGILPDTILNEKLVEVSAIHLPQTPESKDYNIHKLEQRTLIPTSEIVKIIVINQ